ncbi:MAG: hypothetical protein ACD_23C00059G0001, partial [uncultured bacterium]
PGKRLPLCQKGESGSDLRATQNPDVTVLQLPSEVHSVLKID